MPVSEGGVEEGQQLDSMAGNKPRRMEGSSQGVGDPTPATAGGTKNEWLTPRGTPVARETELQVRPARHSYSVGVIHMFLQMVISKATSLRSAAGVFELFAPHLPFVGQTPCANSGRLWMLRIGLFLLTCEKEKADDWVWMMDHTIQLGPYKCLIIVGVRLSAWEADRRPLRHEDMTLLNLTPMEQSTGEAVHEQLQATLAKTGTPQAIVSDGGSDLKRAMELFHEEYPDVRHVYDIKHKMALLLKKELEHDERWAQFVKQANQTKLGTTQTSLAFLNPPGLKTKARYMNLDSLVSWGRRALAYLDSPGDASQPPVDRQKLKEKLGWLRSYRNALERWSELLAIAHAAERSVQTEGIHSLICDELRVQLEPSVRTTAGRRMLRDLLRFLAEQSSEMRAGERLIGSTEVLESIIGKYKRLQGTHSKGGMTAMLLSIGAAIGTTTPSIIHQALEAVRTADVAAWCHKHLGVTLQSQRRLIGSAIKPG